MAEKRPFKVCQAERLKFKGLVAESLEELKVKACKLFEISSGLICLEQDGTEIDDEEYFQFLKPDTKLMVLSQGESWQSNGEDEDKLRQGDEVEEGMEFDVTDSGEKIPHHLITKMKRDPAFFVSFPDQDLEAIVELNTKTLTQFLHRPESQARDYQDASQCELDRRLRMREATDLLKLLRDVKNNDFNNNVRGEIGKKEERSVKVPPLKRSRPNKPPLMVSATPVRCGKRRSLTRSSYGVASSGKVPVCKDNFRTGSRQAVKHLA